MQLRGLTAEGVQGEVRRLCPAAADAQVQVNLRVPYLKRAIAPYQGEVLFALARGYNRAGARFLEIGTAWGYSAAMLAEAAPLATIVTLNPKQVEVEKAQAHLSKYRNVTVLQLCSWDYLAGYSGPPLDFIFVDGDHARVARDLPWWNHVAVGGLMFFHDYSPLKSTRPCPPVYVGLQDFALKVGREPDVVVIDNYAVGMAGWVRRESDAALALSAEGKDWGYNPVEKRFFPPAGPAAVQ